jgi:hypothetical protein
MSVVQGLTSMHLTMTSSSADIRRPREDMAVQPQHARGVEHPHVLRGGESASRLW